MSKPENLVDFDKVERFIRAAANIVETDHIGDDWLTPIAIEARLYLKEHEEKSPPPQPNVMGLEDVARHWVEHGRTDSFGKPDPGDWGYIKNNKPVAYAQALRMAKWAMSLNAGVVSE